MVDKLEKDPLKETKELTQDEELVEVEKENSISVDELFAQEILTQEKKPNFGYMVAGFFVPILGFIMYFIYKKDGKKIEADSFLDGAMIGTFTFIMVLLLVIGYINSL